MKRMCGSAPVRNGRRSWNLELLPWLPGYLRYTAMARYWHAAPAQTYTWKTSW